MKQKISCFALVCLALLNSATASFAQLLDYSDNYAHFDNINYKFLETTGGFSIFLDKDTESNEEICRLKAFVGASDELNDEQYTLHWEMTVYPSRGSMGLVDIDHQGTVIKGSILEPTGMIDALPYVKKLDGSGIDLFSPVQRFLSSPIENKFNVSDVSINTVGEYNDFIASVRDLAGETIFAAIQNPEVTRPFRNKKIMDFPNYLLLVTKEATYVAELTLNITEFIKFIECSEPHLIKILQSPIAFFNSSVLKKTKYFECTGSDPVLNRALPTLSWALGEKTGVATLIQGEEAIDFSLADHSPLTFQMTSSTGAREPLKIEVYRWNNTEQKLLEAQDKMFRGYDVFSRFVLGSFWYDGDIWHQIQIIRNLDYDAEILERQCESKDKAWWTKQSEKVKYQN